MSFINPNFLYALAFLAIPIIIHLFQFRKFKVVRFSKIDFLNEVEEQNNSISKLKHILILLCRLIAISFLVFAFARPYIPTENNSNDFINNKIIGIYIDNSFSMSTENNKGILLDEAIQKGNELVKALPIDQKYVLLSNNFKNETSRVIDKTKASELIQNIESTPLVREIPEVIKRFKSISKEIKEVYFFSDFQKSTADLENLDDTSLSIYIAQLLRNQNENISLDSLSFEQTVHFNKQFNKSLMVSLTPYEITEEREVNAELYLEDQLITPSQFNLLDKQLEGELKFATSEQKIWNKGYLKIEDYPLTFDDTLFFNYKMNEQLNVLHLYDEAYLPSLTALFGKDSTVEYRLMNSSKIDYSQFELQQLIILDELDAISSGLALELKKFLSDGGKLCIIPSLSTESTNSFIYDISGTRLLKPKNKKGLSIREINKNSFIFRNVFDDVPKNLRLPKIDSSFKLKSSALANKEDILLFENNDPFLSFLRKDQVSSLYLFSAPLSINEAFQKNALFVPTFYNMAISGFKNRPLFYFLNDQTIVLDHKLSKETPIHIQMGEKKLIPYQQYLEGSVRIKLNNLGLKAGNYKVFYNDSLIDYISLNYARTESDLAAYTMEEINSSLEFKGIRYRALDNNQNFTQVIKQQTIGEEFWQYALCFALLFFIVEIALLRLMKPVL